MQYANIEIKIKLQPAITCMMYAGMVNGGVCTPADQGKTTRGKIGSHQI